MPDELCVCGFPLETVTHSRKAAGDVTITHYGISCTNPRCKRRTPIGFVTEQGALRFWKEHFSS